MSATFVLFWLLRKYQLNSQVELKPGRERNGLEGLGEKGKLPCSRLDRKCNSVFPGLQKQVSIRSFGLPEQSALFLEEHLLVVCKVPV